MKYYYNDGYHSHGPFTLDQLKSKEIKPSTLINVMGTRHWVLAKEVVELQGALKPTGPPDLVRRVKRKKKLDHNKVKELLNASYSSKKEPVKFKIIDLDSRNKVKNHLFSSIAAIFAFLVLGIIAVINSGKVDRARNRGDIESAKKESRLTRRLAYSGIFFSLGLFLWFLLIAQIVNSIIEIS